MTLRCTETYSLMEYIFSGEYLDQVATIETVSPPGGFCISPSGERIFLTEENSYGVQALTFVYPLDRVGGYVFPAEVVALKSGFGAGWFTCGDKVSCSFCCGVSSKPISILILPS